MATLSEYLQAEAQDRLAELSRALAAPDQPDYAAMYRAARALRGAAQMARDELTFRVAGTLEAALRSVVTGAMTWSDDVAGRVRETADDLRSLVARTDGGETAAYTAIAAVQRWSAVGIRAGGPGVSRSHDAPAGAFREYVAQEVAAIAETLDRSVGDLAATPMNRDPLRTILRRQRALLGAARLDDVPVVAEILRAVEDLTRVIAKLDVGVKQEWLDIYRVARDGLQGAAESLRQDRDPEPSTSLSRLRHMRQELMDRYGAGEAVSVADEGAGLVQATPASEVSPAGVPEVLAGGAGSGHEQEDAWTIPGRGAEIAGSDDDLLLLEEADVAGDAQQPAPGQGEDHAAGGHHSPEDGEEVPGPELLAAAAGAVRRAAATAGPVAELLASAAAGAARQALDAVGDAAGAIAGAADPGAPDPHTPEAGEQGDPPDVELAVVPVEELLYRPDSALARAEELRPVIERVASHDPQAREAVGELFDLIRIARS
jgi:chemotaxis protein histidine kinase CheA